jgi:threonine/homoserine/homoserine lactone efflux protein
MTWFPEPALLGAFIVASVVLAVTPGPGVLFIVARSMSQGRRMGLASVAGVALGNLCNAAGAALGLAALFAVWPAAFTFVKWAGALYLLWLGLQALTAPPSTPATPAGASAVGKVFRDGFFVAVMNPKTTLFFAAFLPQFVSPHGSPALQSVALGIIFVAIAALSDAAYALAASVLAPRLSRLEGAGRAGRYLSASTYIGLGVFTALSGAK